MGVAIDKELSMGVKLEDLFLEPFKLVVINPPLDPPQPSTLPQPVQICLFPVFAIFLRLVGHLPQRSTAAV